MKPSAATGGTHAMKALKSMHSNLNDGGTYLLLSHGVPTLRPPVSGHGLERDDQDGGGARWRGHVM